MLKSKVQNTLVKMWINLLFISTCAFVWLFETVILLCLKHHDSFDCSRAFAITSHQYCNQKVTFGCVCLEMCVMVSYQTVRRLQYQVYFYFFWTFFFLTFSFVTSSRHRILNSCHEVLGTLVIHGFAIKGFDYSRYQRTGKTR